MKKFINLGIGFIKKTQEQHVSFLCTQVSYRLLLAIFPFLLFLIIIVSKVSANSLMQLIQSQDILSESLKNIFMGYLNAVSVSDSLNVAQFSLFSAINIFAVYYMLRCLIPLNNAFNEIMEISDHRSGLRIYTSSLIATLGLLIGIAFVLIIFTIDLFSHIPVINQINALQAIFQFISSMNMLIPALVYAIILTVIYLILPAKHYSLKFHVVNIVISTIIWSIGTWFFTLYLNYNASNFHVVFGSLGTVISLFMWLNFFSQSVLYGFSLTLYIFKEKHLPLGLKDNILLKNLDRLSLFIAKKLGMAN